MFNKKKDIKKDTIDKFKFFLKRFIIFIITFSKILKLQLIAHL